MHIANSLEAEAPACFEVPSPTIPLVDGIAPLVDGWEVLLAAPMEEGEGRVAGDGWAVLLAAPMEEDEGRVAGDGWEVLLSAPMEEGEGRVAGATSKTKA